jgi:hypothetical protein
MFESWEERAWKMDCDQAFGIAAGVKLPASTRSLTRAEAMGMDGGRASLLYLLALFLPLAVIALSIQSNVDSQSRLIWLTCGGALTVILYYVAKGLQQRRSAYVDPEIVVEVREGGVSVRNPAATHQLPDHDLRYEFVHYSHKGSVTFLGIKLDTPLGLLELQDYWYRDARNVAAAIVARAEREKVEGGFVTV